MKASELVIDLGHKQKNINDLIAYLENSTTATPNYSFFLGAGASVTSGISTAIDLVENWRRQTFFSLNEKADDGASEKQMIEWLGKNELNWYSEKTEYSSLFEHKFSLPKQRMDFIEKQVSGKMPSIGYPYLVKLSEKSYCDVVFTTNFDDLLNESFYQFSSERPIVCAHDSSVAGISVATRRPKVIKLHGDFLYNAKSSNNETNRLSDNMDLKLREFLKIFGLIIVGYSGGDKSIMRILDDLVDDNQYLQNGLYWCFRASDEVNENVLNLLKKEGVFFVLIDGFDELMAELYGQVCDDTLPFEPRPGSDFAAKIVKNYEENESLRDSKCQVIRNHMLQLAEAKNSSAVAEALQTLHSERSSRTNLKDGQFVKYVELSKLFKVRNYQAALDKIRSMIEDCDEKEFKTVLYSRLFFAAKSLYQPNEAKRAINAWKALDPENVFLCLPLADVTEDLDERLKILSDGKDKAPFDEDIALRYAEELESNFHRIETNSPPSAGLVVEAYKDSIHLNPSISNSSWRALFDFLQIPASSVSEQKLDLEWIIDEHIKQDSYDCLTVKLLLDWGERTSVNKYGYLDIGEFILKAYNNHYPKNYDAYLSVLKDALLKQGQYTVLKDLILECERNVQISKSSNYIHIKMELLYSVYRDIDNAIYIGEKFIRTDYSRLIEKKLFELYLANGDEAKAKKVLGRLKGAVNIEELNKLESRLCESGDDYQTAVDLLESIAKRKGKDENYFSTVSFLLLKMGEFEKARKLCSEFLKPHNFSSRYDVVIINYEYSKIKLGKNPSKARLAEIIKGSARDEVKSVAKLLMGNTRELPSNIKEAKEELIKEMEFDYSNIDSYSKWPVLDGVDIDFKLLREKLLSSRRKFPKLSGVCSESDNIVDV